MSRFKQIVCCAAFAFAGCGGPQPKLDTATDASVEASLEAMTAEMAMTRW